MCCVFEICVCVCERTRPYRFTIKQEYTKELECFVEVGLKFGAVVVINWNAEKVSIWYMWGLDTSRADVQYI